MAGANKTDSCKLHFKNSKIVIANSIYMLDYMFVKK